MSANYRICLRHPGPDDGRYCDTPLNVCRSQKDALTGCCHSFQYLMLMSSASQVSLNRIPRKPVPRYPEPDPEDPFAPLWLLRSRTASVLTTTEIVPEGAKAISSPRMAFSLNRDLPASNRAHTEPRVLSGHSSERRRSQSIPVTFPFPDLSAPSRSPYGFEDLQSYIVASGPHTSQQSDASMLSSRTSSRDHYGSNSDHDFSFPPTAFPNLSSDTVTTTSSKASSKFRRFLLIAKRSHSTDSHKASLPSSTLESVTESERESRPRSHSEKYALPRPKPPAPSKTKLSVSITSEDMLKAGYRIQPEPPQPSMRSSTLFPCAPSSPTSSIRPHTSSGHSRVSLDRSRTPRPSTAPTASVSIPFNEHMLPTQRQLLEAAKLTVIAENGLRVPFGDLWLSQKTVVCFIRHFWCPLCQDYMFSVSKNVNPDVLKQKGVELIVISNGSHAMIKSYRQIFRMPFAVYTDPTLRIYNALGMTLRSLDGGPDWKRGGYVRHGVLSGTMMVVVNALKVRMPVWEKGGEISQLGGEFVLGPGLTCSFAHRMTSTRSHAPILRVLAAAGVDMYIYPETRPSAASHMLSPEEEAEWMAARKESLAHIRSRRMSRRDGWCGEYGACSNDSEGLDAQTEETPSEAVEVEEDQSPTEVGTSSESKWTGSTEKVETEVATDH